VCACVFVWRLCRAGVPAGPGSRGAVQAPHRCLQRLRGGAHRVHGLGLQGGLPRFAGVPCKVVSGGPRGLKYTCPPWGATVGSTQRRMSPSSSGLIGSNRNLGTQTGGASMSVCSLRCAQCACCSQMLLCMHSLGGSCSYVHRCCDAAQCLWQLGAAEAHAGHLTDSSM
jgi:hypothetical protein